MHFKPPISIFRYYELLYINRVNVNMKCHMLRGDDYPHEGPFESSSALYCPAPPLSPYLQATQCLKYPWTMHIYKREKYRINIILSHWVTTENKLWRRFIFIQIFPQIIIANLPIGWFHPCSLNLKSNFCLIFSVKLA